MSQNARNSEFQFFDKKNHYYRMHEIEDSSSAVGLRDCTVRRSFDGTNADQWEYISEIQGIAQVHPVTSKKEYIM